MKTLLTIAVLAFATSVSRADEQVKDLSPDGKFAMLLTEKEEGGVNIQLIEAGSHKMVVDLSLNGHPYITK